MTYRHIIFDLDHTLWDWERCSAETLSEIFETYRLEHLGIHAKDFIDIYAISIHELWHDYGRGEMTKEQLREKRFPYVFEKMGVAPPSFSQEIEKEYVHLCPRKPHLIPHTQDIFDYLRDKGYHLHLLTNGFGDASQLKIAASGIGPYFDQIVSASEVGHHKPSPIIFDHMLQLIQAKTEDCLMIGDNPFTDIQGAQNAGMHSVLFDPKNNKKSDAEYQISCLSDLKNIL